MRPVLRSADYNPIRLGIREEYLQSQFAAENLRAPHGRVERVANGRPAGVKVPYLAARRAGAPISPISAFLDSASVMHSNARITCNLKFDD
jgi:hypothetical protein